MAKKSNAAYEARRLAFARAAEFLVAADLSKEGFVVHLSASNSPHDMIAEHESGRTLKVQVKCTLKARRNDGDRVTPGYIWPLRTPTQNYKAYSKSQVDLIALVAMDINTIAYLPYQRFADMHKVTLYPKGTPLKRKRSTSRYIEDFTLEQALEGIHEQSYKRAD